METLTKWISPLVIMAVLFVWNYFHSQVRSDLKVRWYCSIYSTMVYFTVIFWGMVIPFSGPFYNILYPTVYAIYFIYAHSTKGLVTPKTIWLNILLLGLSTLILINIEQWYWVVLNLISSIMLVFFRVIAYNKARNNY